jgi:hypothetical protein
MFGCAIKKAFYDFWDNLYTVFLFNLIFVMLGTLVVIFLVTPHGFLFIMIIAIVGFVLLSNFLAAQFLFFTEIANFETPTFKEIFGKIAETWKVNLVISLLYVGVITLVITGVPFYLSARGSIRVIGPGVLLGTSILISLILLFFYPFYVKFDGKIIRSFITSVRFISDNVFFVIGVVVGIGIIAEISSFTLMLFPGPGAMIVWVCSCFKLRMYKYEYLEKNPETNGAIPWNDILEKEREQYKNRGIFGKFEK